MDYDGQRHSFQTLQASKKREESKVARAKEQLEEAKRTFAVFNAELNEEMPALYDSRVLFYLTNLQTLFSAEQVFHSELSKVLNLPSPFPPPPPPGSTWHRISIELASIFFLLRRVLASSLAILEGWSSLAEAQRIRPGKNP